MSMYNHYNLHTLNLQWFQPCNNLMHSNNFALLSDYCCSRIWLFLSHYDNSCRVLNDLRMILGDLKWLWEEVRKILKMQINSDDSDNCNFLYHLIIIFVSLNSCCFYFQQLMLKMTCYLMYKSASLCFCMYIRTKVTLTFLWVVFTI